MDQKQFAESMEVHGVAYIYYTSPTGPKKTTFVVGTLDFNDRYIQAKMEANIAEYGKPYPTPEAGEVVIFSYSKDKFRKLSLKTIVRVASMSAEVNKSVPGRY